MSERPSSPHQPEERTGPVRPRVFRHLPTSTRAPRSRHEESELAKLSPAEREVVELSELYVGSEERSEESVEYLVSERPSSVMQSQTVR